jgi:ribosome-associated protein
MDFLLKGEFIDLDNLLKATNLAASGAQAKQCILAGSVKVNGQVEMRIRRKLRLGDSVEFGEHQISIVASTEDPQNVSK